MNRLLWALVVAAIVLLPGGTAFGGIVIASNSFEASGDTWGYSVSPATYNTGSDVWDVVSGNLGGQVSGTPYGSQYFGLQDLVNDNGGGSFDHVLTTTTLDISSYTDVEVSFSFNADGYDAGDDMWFELVIDGYGYGKVYIVNGVDNGGSSTNGWETISLAIPDSASTLALKLIATQDGGSDYAGWDNLTVTAVPEPSSLLLAGIAVGGLGLRRRRRK